MPKLFGEFCSFLQTLARKNCRKTELTTCPALYREGAVLSIALWAEVSTLPKAI